MSTTAKVTTHKRKGRVVKAHTRKVKVPGTGKLKPMSAAPAAGGASEMSKRKASRPKKGSAAAKAKMAAVRAAQKK